jgi:autotransporter-associated beta strand protein
MQPRRRLFTSTAVLRLSSASALLFTLSVSPLAHAANFYWDADTATAENQNGNGTWNTSNSNWESASTAGIDAQVSWGNTSADTAFLGNVTGTGYTNASTGGTITLGQDITAASLSMSSGQTGSYIIDPGVGLYTLNVLSIGNNNGTATLTVNAVVAGTTLSKLNAGKVILTGANTFTGALSITGGTLAYSNAGLTTVANSLGQSSNIAANLKLSNTTTLQYTGSGGTTDRLFTINGTAAGHSATLDASGAGAINYNNVGSIAYGTTAQTRTLNLAGTNTGNNILAATIADNGGSAVSVTKSGAGTWVLTGTANNYTGNTTISAGTLDVGTISSGALSTSGLLFSGGVLQGNGSFTRAFSGLVTAGANTLSGLTGGFAAKGGALNIDFGGAGALVQLSTGAFRFGNGLTFGSATADNKVTVINSLDLNGNSRTITVNTGTGGDSAELSGAIINQGANSGTFTLTKAGTGLLLLSNANSYASATAVTGGTLKIGNAKSLGFGGIQTTVTTGTTVSSSATLDLNGTTDVNEPIILNGTGIGGIGALVNNSGTAASIGNGIAGGQVAGITGTGSGYSTAPAVTIVGTGSGATATATLGVTASSFAITPGDKIYTVAPTVTIAGGTGATATAILSGGLTGNLIGITITNAGTGFTAAPTIAFGAGTFTSGTISGSGTGNATQFTVSGIAMTAAGTGYTGTPSYTFDSGDATPGTLKLSSVTIAGNTSIGGTGDTTIDAVVSESAAAMNLTKIGAGKLTLTAANTYTGTTTITGGTLALSGSGSINSSPNIIVGASTTFDVSAVTGGYTLAATQTLSGVGTVVGAATIAGTLSPGNSPGSLTVGSQIWLNGGNYNWQMLDATGPAGTGFDTIAMTGTLDLSSAGLTSGGFGVNLWTLSSVGPDVSGNAANFDNTLTQSWNLLTASGGITGFDASDFLINVGAINGTAGFSNALGGGAFSLGVSGGNNLTLTFTAIPETDAAVMAGGMGLLALLRRRRNG